MVKHKHNKPHFELKLSQLPDDTFGVVAFRGQEEISRLFSYRFDLFSEETDIDPADVLNKKATFLIHRGDEDPVSIHGIVSFFEQRGKTPSYVSYSAELVPKMWRLLLTSQTVVYQNTNIVDLLKKVLENAGFAGNDFDIQLDNDSYPELEYVVQFRETDFDFINRRCEHYGIYYCFEHRDDNDIIVFRDKNDRIQTVGLEEDILYNPNRDPLGEKDSITELTCSSKVVTGLFRLKDYNDQTPAADLTVENQIDSDAPGTDYDYGSGHKDAKTGAFLAKVRNEEIYCRSRVFRGKSDCRLFRAGYKFKMGKHYRDDWNEREYILTKVHSRGTQRALFAVLPEAKEVPPTFENEFAAIPFDIAFRPLRITPSPRISGIMSSKVESGSGDEYAYLDDQGRYRIKSPFDLSDKTNGEASKPIRMAQPYSGPGYGLFFPNHAGTEIVWACINGDADRPLGLGTVPNPDQSSPVTLNNKSQNIIRTAAGNEINLDDKTDEAQIGITTPDANRMLFDDKDDKIEIVTTEKHVATFDDKNQNITVQTKNGHSVILDDKNTKITVQSKNGHRICIDDSGGSESITLADKDGKNTFVIDVSNSKLVIKSEEGSIDMFAPKGTIDIKADTFRLATTGDTMIKADANIKSEAGSDYNLKVTGNIKEEASGDFSLKGMNVISGAAMDFNLKGTNVNIKGDMNTKVEAGMSLEAKGNMNAKVEGGVMADFKGGAKTTLSGGIVMIN
jgi:type VI secretion system secreted protein VgrG